MKALVDNDVVLKAARYALLEMLLTNLPPSDSPVGVLGSARFVLTGVLEKSTEPEARDELDRMVVFINENITLEPTQEESELAAEFEAIAQTAGLLLDVGESMLTAVLIVRAVPRLITGDKRAIASIERLIDLYPRMSEIAGKVMCMEQLVAIRLTDDTINTIKAAICRKPAVDIALFACCSCSGPEALLEAIIEGLDSYIRDLRKTAGRTLCA